MAAVKKEDILMAFDFVGSAPATGNNAYLSLDRGVIYWVSELGDAPEDLPDDLETSDRYLTIPHKNDLDLGWRLALRFAAQEMPEQYEQVEELFTHKGAYSRFKELLKYEEILEKWYAFETESVEKALREWCAGNGIEILEKDDEPSV